MKCPKCGAKSRVTNSIFKRDFTVRYRTCNGKHCGFKFKTKESIEGDWDYKRIVKQMKDLLRDVKC